MVFEERIEIAASPDTVFAVYADVEGWRTWDPEVASASLEGSFAPGAMGRLTPTSGRPKEATFTITDVAPTESFTVESRVPLCRLRFDHELTPTPGGVSALHRVTITGALAPLLGRLIGGPIRRGLPATMEGLKRAAEERAKGSPRDRSDRVAAAGEARPARPRPARDPRARDRAQAASGPVSSSSSSVQVLVAPERLAAFIG